MPHEVIAFLEGRLRETACFLEYGAGGSTVLAARVGVAHVYSVESDPAYVAAVRRKVRDMKSASEIRYMRIDIGPTGIFGHPSDSSGRDRWEQYSRRVWKVMARDGRLPDTILVDGRFRVACCLQSLLLMPDDALVLLDDYVGREADYGIVDRLVGIDRIVARAAIFRKPPPDRFAAIREAMLAHVKVTA